MQAPSTVPEAIGQLIGEVVVVAHPIAVAVVVAGDVAQCLGLCGGELAFGRDLPQAFDDLADLAVENPFGAQVDEHLGLAAAFGVERMGGLPQLLQHVQEVEDERDAVEGVADAELQCAFAVGDDHPSAPVARVAPLHLGLHILNEGVLVAIRLAHTRLWLGRGRFGRSGRSPV